MFPASAPNASSTSFAEVPVDRDYALARMPRVMEFESPSSWLSRAALTQGITLQELGRYVGMEIEGDVDVRFLDRVGTSMGIALGLRANDFARAKRMLQWARRLGVHSSGFLRSDDGLPRYRFCRRCLRKHGVPCFRMDWRLSCAQFCTEHECVLEDACSYCGGEVVLPQDFVRSARPKPAVALDCCLYCGRSLVRGGWVGGGLPRARQEARANVVQPVPAWLGVNATALPEVHRRAREDLHIAKFVATRLCVDSATLVRLQADFVSAGVCSGRPAELRVRVSRPVDEVNIERTKPRLAISLGSPAETTILLIDPGAPPTHPVSPEATILDSATPHAVAAYRAICVVPLSPMQSVLAILSEEIDAIRGVLTAMAASLTSNGWRLGGRDLERLRHQYECFEHIDSVCHRPKLIGLTMAVGGRGRPADSPANEALAGLASDGSLVLLRFALFGAVLRQEPRSDQMLCVILQHMKGKALARLQWEERSLVPRALRLLLPVDWVQLQAQFAEAPRALRSLDARKAQGNPKAAQH